MTAQFQRTLPILDDQNTDFWTCGKKGELRILRCQGCEYWIHPPGPVCPKCFGRDLHPEAVSGNGVIFSFTINGKAWAPQMEVPYIIAVVELDEQPGLRMTSNLVGIAPENVKIDMPVEVFFEQDEDIFLPMFKPATAT